MPGAKRREKIRVEANRRRASGRHWQSRLQTRECLAGMREGKGSSRLKKPVKGLPNSREGRGVGKGWESQMLQKKPQNPHPGMLCEKIPTAASKQRDGGPSVRNAVISPPEVESYTCAEIAR